MTGLLLWLVEFLGLKGLKRLSVGIVKWTIRLALLAGLVLLGIVLWSRAKEVLSDENLPIGAAALVALALAFAAFLWLRKRQGDTDAGERTIDGKTVPDKLAAAALAIPARSPDAGYVLRGLPDYGKTLLKLDAGAYEYLPEMPEEEIPESPVEEPATRGWSLASQINWESPYILAAVAVAIVLVLWGIDYKKRKDDDKRIEEQKAQKAQQKAREKAQENETRRREAEVQVEPEAKANSQPDTQRLWSANSQPFDWYEASEHCSALQVEGRKWRLPTIQELSEIWAGKKDRLMEMAGSRTPIFWSVDLANPQDGGEDIYYALAGSDKPSRLRLRGSAREFLAFRALCVSDPKMLDDFDGKERKKTATSIGSAAGLNYPSPRVNKYPSQEFAVDPETGKAWTTRDNGPEPIKDYDEAARYCKSLDVGGVTGWRLPSFDELSNLSRFFVNFKLSQPSELLWSSTLDDDMISALDRRALRIGQIPIGADFHSFTHAVCVHEPFRLFK